jgi:hypothetical protein
MADFMARLPAEEQAKIRAGSKVISSEIKQARAKLRAKKVKAVAHA